MSAISESIREAALSWPMPYIGATECDILGWAFLGRMEPQLTEIGTEDITLLRTFMLLVAEALE